MYVTSIADLQIQIFNHFSVFFFFVFSCSLCTQTRFYALPAMFVITLIFFISPLLQALLGMLLQSCGGAFKECSKNHFLNQCARNFVCTALSTALLALRWLVYLSWVCTANAARQGCFGKIRPIFTFNLRSGWNIPRSSGSSSSASVAVTHFFPVSWRLITFVASLLSV